MASSSTHTAKVICDRCFLPFQPPQSPSPLPEASTSSAHDPGSSAAKTVTTCGPCSRRLAHRAATTLLSHYGAVIRGTNERLRELRVSTVSRLAASHTATQSALDAHISTQPPLRLPWRRMTWGFETKRRQRRVEELTRQVKDAESEIEYLTGEVKRVECLRKQEVLKIWRDLGRVWPNEAGTNMEIGAGAEDVDEAGEDPWLDPTWQEEEERRAEEVRRQKDALGEGELRKILEDSGRPEW